jgi:hypothetical protein
MNEMWVYTYLILPFVVAGLGYAFVRFVERDARHHGPAE